LKSASVSPSEFISEFTSSHQFVADYLIEEVLTGLPDEVRNFMLQTSALGCLSWSLCDAVTGQTGSQEMLEWLERANLFTVRLDDDREWFRYHHLFADLLWIWQDDLSRAAYTIWGVSTNTRLYRTRVGY
jgi:LuxR family maltose regulon positive regulatory protein